MILLVNKQKLIDSINPQRNIYKGWTWRACEVEPLYGMVRYWFHIKNKNLKQGRMLGIVLSSRGKFTNKEMAEYIIDQHTKEPVLNERITLGR